MSVPPSARTAAAEASTAAGESAATTSKSASATHARDPAATATAAEHRKDDDYERAPPRDAGNQQGPGDKPRRGAGHPGADGGAADVAEHRAQYRSNDRNRHQQHDQQGSIV